MRRTRTSRPSPLLVAGLASLALAAAAPARAANLLENGSFETGLSGWISAGEVSWSESGAGAPGSARLGGSPGIVGALALSQCVSVNAGTDYDLRAAALVPYSPEAAGGVSLRVVWHQEAACAPGTLGTSPSLDFVLVPPAAWSRRALPRLRAPEGAASASVLVVPWSSGPASAFSAYLDDVELVPSDRFETLTVPTAASVDGARGERFQTSLTVRNPAPVPRRLDLRLRCRADVPCATASFSLLFGPRETRAFPDVLLDVFGRRSGAGAIEITYDATLGPVVVSARAETVHAERPGNGMALPVLPASSARTSAAFTGLSDGRGGDGGTRVNAGAYNPHARPVTVTYRVREAAGDLGQPVSRVLEPFEWFQFDALFDHAGAGQVRPGSHVTFASDAPVFPFLVAVDNRSGDPTHLEPRESFQP